MPDFSTIQAGTVDTIGASTAASRGTVITASASINTKGNWTQFIASTTAPAAWMIVTFNGSPGAGRILADIGVGGAGSEQVLIPNLSYQSPGTFGAHAQYMFPVSLPAGSRVAARCQSSAVSRQVTLSIMLVSPSLMGSSPFGVVTDYGTSTVDSGATSVDPGAVAHTKGSWVELTASTLYPIKWGSIFFGADTTTRTTAYLWLADIGVGASGSEVVVVPNIALDADSSTDVPRIAVFNLPLTVPAGSRIAVRAQCNLTTATERLLDVALYGVS